MRHWPDRSRPRRRSSYLTRIFRALRDLGAISISGSFALSDEVSDMRDGLVQWAVQIHFNAPLASLLNRPSVPGPPIADSAAGCGEQILGGNGFDVRAF